MRWYKKIFITLLVLPLAGIVFAGRWVNKILGKDKNPFEISEADAQSSCWTTPGSCDADCANYGGDSAGVMGCGGDCGDGGCGGGSAGGGGD